MIKFKTIVIVVFEQRTNIFLKKSKEMDENEKSTTTIEIYAPRYWTERKTPHNLETNSQEYQISYMILEGVGF